MRCGDERLGVCAMDFIAADCIKIPLPHAAACSFRYHVFIVRSHEECVRMRKCRRVRSAFASALARWAGRYSRATGVFDART